MEGAMFDSQWLIGLGMLEPIAIVVALLSIARSGMARRFPSLTFALIIELATDIFLDVLLHHPTFYTAYFCTYWASVFLQSAIRLWVIADVVRSLPGIGFLPRSIYLFVGASGAAMAIASVAYSLHGSGLCPQMTNLSIANASLRCLDMCLRSNISAMVRLIDRCVCGGWLAFEIALLASIKALRLGWSRIGAHVANGITARVCTCFVVSRLISVNSSQIHNWAAEIGSSSSRYSHYWAAQIGSLTPARIHHWANGFESLCSIAVFLFWSYQFSLPLQILESEGDDQYTKESLDDLLAISAGRER